MDFVCSINAYTVQIYYSTVIYVIYKYFILYLVKIGRGRVLAGAHEIGHIDELVFIAEAGVRELEGG